MAQTPNSNFGIRLKPISQNKKWHNTKKQKLKNALIGLQKLLGSKNLQNKLEESDIQNALEYIRYLFKDYAFRDEEEFRLLRIEAIDSENVKLCPHTHTIYLEYDFIDSMVDEMILGTNYEYT